MPTLFHGVLQKIKNRWMNTMFPLKSMIIYLFIPSIMMIVIIMGYFSYLISVRQVQSSASVNIMDTVTQTRDYLDNRLSDVFQQLVILAEESNTNAIVNQLGYYSDVETENYLSLNQSVDRIYNTYYSMLDSIFVILNDGKVLVQKKDFNVNNIKFNFNEFYDRYGGRNDGYVWLNLQNNIIADRNPPDDKTVSLQRIIGDKDSLVKGILSFQLRESWFVDILANPQISEHGYLALVGEVES
ncbi:cache domain-containing protein [Paenibacillus hexagrammi]|uniref:Cache domain-containing protein n=1 Tax=Paenibacillus hexagrammi TaxID=2908839 RepID=A0ABY3SHH0_9BACL|nr:cache domain-containing protein [Paenibacillus sp. YPD9-1]UJF32641.1 cache domain-containing protein [Paenibacillus sp. YPD9-1]